MSGLKERLHGLPVWGYRDPADGRWHEDDTPREAATLIESQEAEIAALREALERIRDWCFPVGCVNCRDNKETARSILEKRPQANPWAALRKIIAEYENGSPASDLAGIAARVMEGMDG